MELYKGMKLLKLDTVMDSNRIFSHDAVMLAVNDIKMSATKMLMGEVHHPRLEDIEAQVLAANGMKDMREPQAAIFGLPAIVRDLYQQRVLRIDLHSVTHAVLVDTIRTEGNWLIGDVQAFGELGKTLLDRLDDNYMFAMRALVKYDHGNTTYPGPHRVSWLKIISFDHNPLKAL